MTVSKDDDKDLSARLVAMSDRIVERLRKQGIEVVEKPYDPNDRSLKATFIPRKKKKTLIELW